MGTRGGERAGAAGSPGVGAGLEAKQIDDSVDPLVDETTWESGEEEAKGERDRLADGQDAN